MEAIKNMNGTIWVFAIILIGLVLVQSFLFLRLALRFNKKHQLASSQELKDAVRVGGIAAVGPSLSSIVVALSLIAMVGSGTAFMRCGVIGSPGWELFMANIAASVAGTSFGSPDFTESVFTFCIFCMVLASAPYFINTIIMLKPLDTMVEKSKAKKKKISFMPYLATSSMFGLLTYIIMDYLSSAASIAAVIGAAVGYILCEKLAKKLDNATLGSFALAIGMVFGMAAGQICASLIA